MGYLWEKIKLEAKMLNVRLGQNDGVVIMRKKKKCFVVVIASNNFVLCWGNEVDNNKKRSWDPDCVQNRGRKKRAALYALQSVPEIRSALVPNSQNQKIVFKLQKALEPNSPTISRRHSSLH